MIEEMKDEWVDICKNESIDLDRVKLPKYTKYTLNIKVVAKDETNTGLKKASESLTNRILNKLNRLFNGFLYDDPCGCGEDRTWFWER